MAKSLFKLIFEHDLRLETLAENHDPRNETKRPSTLEEFLKPVQTYSNFYFSATDLEQNHFGFNVIPESDAILKKLEKSLKVESATNGTDSVSNISEFQFKPGQTWVIKPTGQQKTEIVVDQDLFDSEKHIREKIHVMRAPLDAGLYILFVEKAHHGYDLYLFSKENIYERFFEAYQPMVSTDFRFFSINGKRAKSERLFYFETWTLNRPPHGFEEVFTETRLR